jgi:hypothetical protein
MYNEKSIGESIPPCLTPFVILKKSEVQVPHLIHRLCILYQYINIRTIIIGTDLDISLLNKAQWFTLSKALEASKKHENTGLLRLL